MASYASNDLVRSLCGVSSTELSDDELSGLLSLAVGLFNSEVNIDVGSGKQEFELLTPDEEDTTNTRFYTAHYPIADSDGDGAVSTGDIEVWDDLKQENPTTCDVTAVTNYKTGLITLAVATTDERYASYSYTVLPYESTAFKMAFCYFACMLIWDRLIATAETVSMGNMSVSRKNYFKDRWEQAKSKMMGSMSFSMVDSNVRMDSESDYFNDPDAEEG